MNRGHLLQSSPLVQQMMAGSPNWWNMNNSMRPPSQQASSPLLAPTAPNLFPQFVPVQPSSSWSDNQELPDQSWSQLLLRGLVNEEDEKASGMQAKKFENWDQEQLLQQPLPNGSNNAVDDHVKQENSGNGYMYGHENADQFHASAKPTWSSSPMVQVSSPTSCVTTLSNNNMLDFSSNKSDARHPPPDRSSECNSTAIGGAPKKARVQATSTQSSFKVRKEKLGDRVTALHQLVSPFGKTDTASVLLEAIGYIRFLQSQIEALSLPYLGTKSGNLRQQQHAQGDRNCLFPEDPGQLLNDNCMKRKAAGEQDCGEEPKKDLGSRGLCLVPVSCTLQVGSDNGADYWAPAFGGGFR